MEERAKQISEYLKVLANENRLLILNELTNGPRTVSEIGTKIPKITQSALSQHLSILKAHGILSFEKSGQKVKYYILDWRVEEIMKTLREYY